MAFIFQRLMALLSILWLNLKRRGLSLDELILVNDVASPLEISVSVLFKVVPSSSV
jgi:hypothetical protein